MSIKNLAKVFYTNLTFCLFFFQLPLPALFQQMFFSISTGVEARADTFKFNPSQIYPKPVPIPEKVKSPEFPEPTKFPEAEKQVLKKGIGL